VGGPALVACGVAALGLAAFGQRWLRAFAPSLAPWAVILVAALAAARAHALGAPGADGASGATGPAGLEPPAAGVWREARRTGEWARGRITGHAAELSIPAGGLRDGDGVVVLAAEVVPRARAPGAAPAPARIDVALDALCRVRPAALPREPARTLERARAWGLARLDAIPDERARGLARAFVFGDRSAVSYETAQTFTRTGARHFLALSGLHVGLLGAGLIGPLGRSLAVLVPGRWKRGRGWGVARSASRALAMLALIPLAGAAPPVKRAALAAALACLAPLAPAPAPGSTRGRACGPRGAHAGRRVDSLSLWAFALALECAADPRAPFELDVQLSYAAALALIVGYRGAERALRACLPGGLCIAPFGPSGHPRSPYWRVPAQRLADACVGAWAASLAAVLGTLPIVWATFGELSPTGICAAPLALAGVAAFLIAAWGWMLAPVLIPVDAPLLAARALVGGLEWLDRSPGTPLTLPARPALLVGAAAGLALAALASPGARGRRRAARAAALAGGVVLVPWAPDPRGLELHVLDVGHGTACLLRAPGEPCWVFDAGSRDRPGLAQDAIAPLLRAWEVRRLDVVVSHGHRDHASALDWLTERWPVRLWAGAQSARLAVRAAHAELRVDLAEGRIALSGRAGAQSPLGLELSRAARGEGNEGSCNLRVELAGEVFVLCGDAEGPGLVDQLADGALRGPARVLLAPHHGSQTPHLAALLDAARPAEVWVSSPIARGPPPIAAELRRRGVPLRWTGGDGPLSHLAGAR